MLGQGVIPSYTPEPIVLDNKLDINSVYRGDVPDIPVQSVGNGSSSFDSVWNSAPVPSLQGKGQPAYFDWDKSRSDRFVNSDYYKSLGADPSLNNEYRYGEVQTGWDVTKNALAGGWKLGAQTFVEGWKGWGNMANALFNWSSEDSFNERLMGTPEELMEQYKAQEAIFNKYAIFSTPESEKSIWNKQFLGDLVQQSGFTLGAVTQFAVEELLTAGAATYLKPFTAARALKGLENTGRVVNLAENTAKATKIGNDLIKETGIAQKIWEGTRKFVPLAGASQDAVKAYRNGEGLLQAGMIGLGGVKRSLSEFNMAATEARFEAAGTYGHLYGDLYDQFATANGRAPEGAELERIQNMAQDAAWDNFRVNTGILMVANRIQFDGMLNKFSSSRSTLKNAADQATSELFPVTATKEGKKVVQVFNKGKLGKLSAYGDINKSLGRKAANWEAFKSIMSGAGKWEISEGVQELSQETSNTALSQYYTDLYNGKDADLGTAVQDAAREQVSMQGLKTFLMGAVTGRLISPLSYTATKVMERAGSTRDQRDQKKQWIEEQRDIINSVYSNLPMALSETVANTKVGNRQTKNMTGALKDNSRYQYNNDKETLLAKAVSAAIKTNMLPSLTDTLRSYGDYFTQEEWKQAYGDLGKEQVQTYTQKVATEIEDFANRWEELKDKFGDLVMPESAPKNSEEYKLLQQKKWALDSAIEVLATADYKQKKSLQRAAQLMAEVSANPDFGGSANQAFRVLGDLVASMKEIEMLGQEIATSEQLENQNDELKKQLADKKEQMKHLQDWVQNLDAFADDDIENEKITRKMLSGFRGYINTINRISGKNSVINESDIHDAFWKLSDYTKLYSRSREMLNAFNTLVDPLNFKGWVLDIEGAGKQAGENLKAEQEKELEEFTKEPELTDDLEDQGNVVDVPEEEPEDDIAENIPVDIEELEGGGRLAEFIFADQNLISGQPVWKGTEMYRVLEVNNNGYLKLRDPQGKTVTVTDNKSFEKYSTLGPEVPFDGQLLRQGQVITGPDEREWRVDRVKPSGDLHLVALYTTNSTNDISSLRGYTYESVQPVIAGERKTYESIGDILNIYPHREQGESVEEARSRFSEQLGKLDKEDFNNHVSLVVSYNDKYTGRFQPSAGNPNISNASGPLTVQLQYKGKPVGYLTQPEMVTLLTDKGEVLSTTNITQADFSKVYKINTREISAIQAYNEFITNRLNAEAVQDELLKQLGTKESVTLSAQQVAKLVSINVDGGTFNWINEQEGAKLVPFNKLSTKTAKINGKRHVVIVDRLQVQSPSGPIPWYNSKYIGEGATVYTDATEPGDIDAAQQLWDSVQDRADNLGRYVGLITFDNGQTKVLELTPQQMEDKKVTAAIQSVHDRIKQTRAENLDTLGDPKVNEFNDQFNTELNTDLFISPARGYISLEVSPSGILRLDYYLYTGKGQPAFRAEVYDDNNAFNNVKTPEDLSNFINELIEAHDSKVSEEDQIASRMQRGITPQSFKQGVGTITTVDRLAKMNTRVDKNIASNWRLTYHYQGQIVPRPATQRSSVPANAIQPDGQKATKKKVSVEKQPTIDTQIADIERRRKESFNNLMNPRIGISGYYLSKDAKKVDYTSTSSVTEALKLHTLSDFTEVKITNYYPEKRTLELSGNVNTPPGGFFTINALRAYTDAKYDAELAALEQQNKSVDQTTLLQNVLDQMDEDAGAFIEDPSAEIVSVDSALTELEADADSQEQQLMDQYMQEGMSRVAAAKKASREVAASMEKRRAQLSADSGIIDEVFKISDQQFDSLSAGQVTEFKNWAVQNLPDFIQVAEVQQLQKNLLGKGVPVASFITLIDKINGAVTGGKITTVAGRYGYHEAFHGVFRLLLDDKQVDRLLSLASQEARPTKQQLQEFRSLHPNYRELTDQQLEERYLEEYMADKFQAWVENKSVQTSPTIKGFFARLWEWIKSLFNDNTTRGELEALYSRIDQGGFRNSNIIPNRFNTVSIPVYKLIEVGDQIITDEDGNKVRTNKYLTSAESNKIATNVAALFQRLADQRGSYNKNQLLDEVLDIYAENYNIESDRNTALLESIVDNNQLRATINRMNELFKLYTNEASTRSIKEAADLFLNAYGYKGELDSDVLEELTEDLGDRGVADQLSEKESFGGLDTMSQELKRYINSLTPNGQDEFGRNYFDEQEIQAIPQALDLPAVYTGTLKALKDSADKLSMLDKMQQLSEAEGHAGTFSRLFLADTGLYKNDNGQWILGNELKANTVQLVLNGFNQFNVDYVFLLRSEEGDIIISDANQQNMVKLQVTDWQDGYNNLYLNKRQVLSDPKQISELNTPIKTALNSLRDVLQKGKVTPKQSQDIARVLTDRLGLSLTPEYIRFSVAMGSEKPTGPQQKLIDLYGDRYAMTPEDAGWIAKTFTGNLYRGFDMEDEGGALSRIIRIASGNVLFDERVDSTSHLNAANNRVQSIQLPTYHTVMAQRLKQPKYQAQLAQNPFLQDHPLLKQLMDGTQPEFFRASGTRTAAGYLDKTTGMWKETRSYEVNQRAGQTYGDFGPQEFTDFNLNMYAKFSKQGTQYMVPSLIRVLEASNTGDFVRLPVIRSVKRVGKQLRMTPEALDIQFDVVNREFQRIKRVMTETKDPLADQLEGYHYKLDNNGNRLPGRGHEFFNAKLMLPDNGRKWLDKLAEDPDYQFSKSDIAEIKSDIEKYRLNQFQQLVQYLKEQELLNINDKGGLNNLKLGKFLQDGITTVGKTNDNANTALNLLPGDMEYNLAQVYINDVLNTTLINQLLRGDEATGLKDAVDAVKRARIANGSGSSITAPFPAVSLGIERPFVSMNGVILTEPKYRKLDGSLGDKADGQTWVSSFAYRHVLYGLGKLTPKVARILDKVDRGEKISADDIFNTGGLIDSNGMFLPIKLVYYDGQKAVKTSVAMIPREMVSYKDKQGNWQPLPGRDDLHTLLDTLENQEDKTGVPSFAGPQSAFKQQKRNVLPSGAQAEDRHFTSYDTDFWRLQLENPSNKLQITDPTQSKQIIIAGQDASDKTEVAGKPVSEWVEQYLRDTSKRVTNSYLQARDEIFDIADLREELQGSIANGQISPKLAEFQDRAVENLIASGAGSQMIGFFRTKAGEPVYDLNGPATITKYTQLFMSYFTKGVMSEKIPGHSLILMSNYGMKIIRKVLAGPDGQLRLNKQGVPIDFEIIPMSKIQKDPVKYQRLGRKWDELTDIGPRSWSDIKVGDYLVDDLRHDLDELDEQGNPTGIKYSEIMIPPHYREYMSKNPNDIQQLLKGFGVRIPTQDKSSFTNTRVVDFLPVYLGSTIVGSQELIEISGADFDVDKLYLQVPDTYVDDNGERVLYSTNSYEEYVQYMITHNNAVKNEYKKYKRGLTPDVPFDSLQELTDVLTGNKRMEMLPVYQQMLKRAGYPSTEKEFRDSGIINNGVLNNRILDAKRALFTNPYTVDNGAYSTVSTKPLQDLADRLAEKFKDTEFADRLNESPTETNDLLGKIAAYTNNKAGSRGIGPIANALLVYSLLNSFGVKFRDNAWKFKLDGKTFEGYTDQSDTAGNRIASTISQMVSMETDNAKERLHARFGLTMESLGQVANLVGQGVPLESAILFINQPIIQEYFKLVERNSGALTLKGASKQGIINNLLDREINGVKSGMAKRDGVDELTTQLLEEGIAEEGADPVLNIKVLEEFKDLQEQTRYFSDLAQVVKIVKGLPGSFEEIESMMDRESSLGLDITDNKEFEKHPVPFDLREIMNKQHDIMANYRAIRDQVVELSKSMFIEQTPAFKRITDVIRANTRVNPLDRERFYTGIKKDLIAYLSIKGYKNLLENKGKGNRLSSVNNSLIYRTEENVDFPSVLTALDHVRQVLPQNYMARFFMNPIAADLESNRELLDKIEANTWSKLSELQTEKVIDSFMEIYQNPDTRTDAWTLFHYLLVKDGGQFKSNSYVNYIPNPMFKDLLDSLSAGRKLMADENYSDTEYNKVFGSTATELYTDFIRFYTEHYDSRIHLPWFKGIYQGEEAGGFKPQSVQLVDGNIRINIFEGIREVQEFDAGEKGIIRFRKKGKFTEQEKSMFSQNMKLIENNFFRTETEGEQTKIQFPVVIRQSKKSYVGGEQTGVSYLYYRLVSVDNNTELSKMIRPGTSIAQGTKAVYEPFELKGARNTFKLAEMNGYLPINTEVYKPRESNFDNIEEVDYTNIDDILPVALPRGYRQVADRLHPLGITVSWTQQKGWEFSGGAYDKLSKSDKKQVVSPQDLFAILEPQSTGEEFVLSGDEDLDSDDMDFNTDTEWDVDELDDMEFEDDPGTDSMDEQELTKLKNFTMGNNNPLNDQCA